MKKMDQFLHTLFWVAPGMFAGIALYEYIDCKACPGLYAMRSAPWYVGLLMPGIVCLGVMAAAWIIRRVIRKRLDP